MKRCEAEGCLCVVPSEMLMCRRHWRMVPKRNQEEVWLYWKQVERGVYGAAELHRIAKSNAIESVRKQERKNLW